MAESLDAVIEASDVVGRTYDLNYDNGISLIGAYLKPGQSVSFEKPFEGDGMVFPLAGGDDGAGDVDLQITRNGILVAEDKDSRSAAVAAFEPSRGTYRITMSLASGRASFVTLIILREGDGWSIPIDNLQLAGASAIVTSSVLASKTPMKFMDGGNQLCLFGGVVKPNEEMRLTSLDAVGPFATLVGACDDQSDDIDLTVRDRLGGLLGSDTEDDDTPIVFLGSGARSTDVRLRNLGPKPTFGIVAMLRG